MIGVNRAFEYVPCDYVYLADKQALVSWYDAIRALGDVPIITPADIPSTFRRCYRVVGRSGEGLHRIPGYVNFGGSGGYQAINYAYHLRAGCILLVGYDYQHTAGQTHVHGDHPAGWANFGSPEERGEPMTALAMDLVDEGVSVINYTRSTSLRCFTRGNGP